MAACICLSAMVTETLMLAIRETAQTTRRTQLRLLVYWVMVLCAEVHTFVFT